MNRNQRVFGFFNEFRFLSNFYPSKFILHDIVWPSVEHYFQAMKSLPGIKSLPEAIVKNISDWEYLAYHVDSPKKIKHLGYKIKLRNDWEFIKISIMFQGVLNKFEQNLKLMQLLFATENKLLVEANTWNDTFWGVNIKTNIGLNNLGIILMEVRSILRMMYPQYQ